MLIDIVMREKELDDPLELLRLSPDRITWMLGERWTGVPYTEWAMFHPRFYREPAPVEESEPDLLPPEELYEYDWRSPC